MYYGWLDSGASVATSYEQGDLLIIEATPLGTLDEAAADAAATTTIGILGPVSPRRQDMAPLTSATAPAAALPLQRSTPAALADFTNSNDPDFGILYYPLIPGNMFVSHVCLEDDGGGTPGTDIQADPNLDINEQWGNTITHATAGGGDEVRYATKGGIHLLARSGSGTIAGAWAFSLHYAFMQLTSLAGSAFSVNPGKIIAPAAGSGTFNPIVVWVPTASVLF